MRKMGTVPLKYDMFNNLKLYSIFMNVVILYIRHLYRRGRHDVISRSHTCSTGVEFHHDDGLFIINTN